MAARVLRILAEARHLRKIVGEKGPWVHGHVSPTWDHPAAPLPNTEQGNDELAA
jgi:hypothetical protein